MRSFLRNNVKTTRLIGVRILRQGSSELSSSRTRAVPSVTRPAMKGTTRHHTHSTHVAPHAGVAFARGHRHTPSPPSGAPVPARWCPRPPPPPAPPRCSCTAPAPAWRSPPPLPPQPSRPPWPPKRPPARRPCSCLPRPRCCRRLLMLLMPLWLLLLLLSLMLLQRLTLELKIPPLWRRGLGLGFGRPWRQQPASGRRRQRLLRPLRRAAPDNEKKEEKNNANELTQRVGGFLVKTPRLGARDKHVEKRSSMATRTPQVGHTAKLNMM